MGAAPRTVHPRVPGPQTRNCFRFRVVQEGSVTTQRGTGLPHVTCVRKATQPALSLKPLSPSADVLWPLVSSRSAGTASYLLSLEEDGDVSVGTTQHRHRVRVWFGDLGQNQRTWCVEAPCFIPLGKACPSPRAAVSRDTG